MEIGVVSYTVPSIVFHEPILCTEVGPPKRSDRAVRGTDETDPLSLLRRLKLKVRGGKKESNPEGPLCDGAHTRLSDP